MILSSPPTCDKDYDDQIVEFGVITTVEERRQLGPIDLKLWIERMDKTRQKEMNLAKIEVEKVLKEIDDYNRTGGFIKEVGTRRAIVFTLMKEQTSLLI